MSKYSVLCVILSFLLVVNLYGQESNADILAPPDSNKKSQNPVEYDQNEFPDWAYYVYRFAAVSVGSIPFTLLIATVGYDIYKTTDESMKVNSFESQYLPLFFSGPDKPAYDDPEVQNLMWATLALSLTTGLIDLIILLVKKKQAVTIESLFQ